MVKVLDKEKPRSEDMLELLREFLYLVCTRGFTPIFKHVGTKKNAIADFLSRNHHLEAINSYVKENNVDLSLRREVPDGFFRLSALW